MIRRLRPMLAAPLFTILMLMNGCAWGLGNGEEDTPEMHRNLSRAVDIQTGVIQGDLERARRAAAWLVSRENRTSFTSEARGYEGEMLGYAALIAEGREMETVAIQAGQLAAACGSCHRGLRGGPNFVVGSDAPGGGTQEAHMVRHLWAADRMWEGLVGPSEEAWVAGARALARTETSLAPTFRAPIPPGVLEGLLSEVSLLAEEALSASGQDERGDVYGRMLFTCNRCHALAGVFVAN